LSLAGGAAFRCHNQLEFWQDAVKEPKAGLSLRSE
jgi:hypothetical protein